MQVSAVRRTDLSQATSRREQEHVQFSRPETLAADSALTVGAVDDVCPVVTLFWGMVSLCVITDQRTALTPPDGDAITAILRLDRTRCPVSCDDPVVSSAPAHVSRPETGLLKGVLVTAQL